ncbi:MAG TPA: tRNA pseudouridine(55) synthase TruB, partial [Actinomycetota bacterium]|nr:tRNA pseudouridine(55) synthase TruB [Actinomycetota bacterium]
MPSGVPPGGAEPYGVVVVDKPAGPTSHDVVARLRKLFATRRVGHAGTLDPAATGILLVGLGRATRVLQFLQALPKCYRAEVAFGTTTSTQDATGAVLAHRACRFDRSGLLAAMAALTGPIEQVPPMVSAVRVGGERLYAAARRGEEVERAARPVTVYAFALESFDPESWSATVLVRCSSGTYVRTLAADLGGALGCGAHLRSLRRLAVGSLTEAEAVTLPGLEAMPPEDRVAVVLSPAAALRDLKAVPVEGGSLEGVRHGRALEGGDPGGALGAAGDGEPLAILTPEGELVAVYRRDGAALRAACVLV